MLEALPVSPCCDEKAPPTEVVCALDLGSKNFKLVTGCEVEGRVHTKLLDKVALHLGQEVKQSGGTVREAKLAEIEQALHALTHRCRQQGISTILAIATNAIRQTTNNGEIVALAKKLGIDLEIADGRREGEVGYLAATHGEPYHMMAELGSRSCQIAWDIGKGIAVTPLPFGYRRLYEAFFQEAVTFEAAATAMRSFLASHIPLLPDTTTAFVALAANSVAGFVLGKEKPAVTGILLSRPLLMRKSEALALSSPAHFAHLKHHTPKVNKILPGLVFLGYMLEKSGHDEVEIVEAELPVGLIVEYFQSV